VIFKLLKLLQCRGAGFFATSLDKAVGLARSYSLWPLPFATSAVVSNLWLQWLLLTICRDWCRAIKFFPRQADLLMVMVQFQKRWVRFYARFTCKWPSHAGIGNGCLCFKRWLFDTYSVLQGIDESYRLMSIYPGARRGPKLSSMVLYRFKNWCKQNPCAEGIP